ncbi:hypothetical protein JNW89_17555, partial [Micromonospora sp. 4G55]|nr:hypothetical protein [Micromonospora sp. 4G55]
MLLEPDAENEVAYELCQLLGRAILPVRPAGPADDGPAGTAFFFAHPTGEYLLTADVLTRVEAGEVGLRPSVTEPAGVAPDALVLSHFTDRWAHLPDAGVAVLSTAGLHERAAGQGWRWRTQPVPDAVAAARTTWPGSARSRSPRSCWRWVSATTGRAAGGRGRAGRPRGRRSADHRRAASRVRRRARLRRAG